MDLTTLTLAVRTTRRLAQASVAAPRALVLVTALTPMFALLLAALAVREAGERARGGPRRAAVQVPRMRVIPARGMGAQSGRLFSS
jgi:hypothetical protein